MGLVKPNIIINSGRTYRIKSLLGNAFDKNSSSWSDVANIYELSLPTTYENDIIAIKTDSLASCYSVYAQQVSINGSDLYNRYGNHDIVYLPLNQPLHLKLVADSGYPSNELRLDGVYLFEIEEI